MIKLFEEYRMFSTGPWSDQEFKDPDEPFFSVSKKKYIERKKEEKKEAERQERQVIANHAYIEGLEKARRQEQTIRRYIDIVQNDPVRILKTKYQPRDENNLACYGIQIDDGAIIISKYYNNKSYNLRINGENMSPTKEKKNKKDVDVYGEENWEDDERSPYEILSELVKDHVSKNEIIF